MNNTNNQPEKGKIDFEWSNLMAHISLRDHGAAYLAAGLVAKSEKVQSVRFITGFWEQLRQDLDINTRIDYLVSILTQGRLMDLKITKGDYVEIIRDNISNIRRELIIALTQPLLGEKDGSEILAETYIVRLNDVAAAFITATYVRISEKVESVKEILELWTEIRKMDIVHDNNEFLTSLLATSRGNDLSKMIRKGGGLNVLIEDFQSLSRVLNPDQKVTKADLAAAHLTNAIVGQSPEIESIGELLRIWNKVKADFPLENDDLDVVAAILTGGLILNRTQKQSWENVIQMFQEIKSKLDRSVDLKPT